jgi:hypothetical protein
MKTVSPPSDSHSCLDPSSLPRCIIKLISDFSLWDCQSKAAACLVYILRLSKAFSNSAVNLSLIRSLAFFVELRSLLRSTTLVIERRLLPSKR